MDQRSRNSLTSTNKRGRTERPPGSTDHTIRLWDPTTGAETVRLEGYSGWVNTRCVLPDGRLVSGSPDRTIRLWDPTTGAESACLEIDAKVGYVIGL